MTVAGVCRVALGLVFLWSGANKVVDRHWPDAAAAFGAPTVVARVLPAFELALGAVLVVGISPASAAWVAVGLLVVFSAVLIRALRTPSSDRPVCACFGARSARPVSVVSLVRNVGFVALGVVAALG